MRIDRAELFLVPLRLQEPFETGRGATRDRAILLVALHGEGQVGWGECVAGETPSYTAETTETAWHVLVRWILPAVVRREFTGGASAVPLAVAWIRGHAMAKAAVEMAMWDLQAKLADVPLCDAIGGRRRSVPVGVSIGLQQDDDALLPVPFSRYGLSLEEKLSTYCLFSYFRMLKFVNLPLRK